MPRERVRFEFLTASLLIAIGVLALHRLIPPFRALPGFELVEDVAFAGLGALLIVLILRAWSADARRTATALRDSEARYRSLVGSMDDFVFLLDTDQRFVAAFGRWARRERLETEVVAGRTLTDVFGPAFETRHRAAFARVLQGDSADYDWTGELSGSQRSFQTALAPLSDDDGNVVGAVGITRDVTERVALDGAFRDTAEMLHAVVAAAPVAIMTLDEHGRVRSANSAAEKILGKPQSQLLGEMLVRPAESEEASRLLRECAANGASFTAYQVTRWRDDGRRVHLSLSAAPLHGAHGVVALATDISERVQANEILERYRTMTGQIRDLVLFVGAAGRIVDANDAAATAYGWSRDELIGLQFDAIQPDGTLAAQQAPFETVHLRRDGSHFPVEITTATAEFDGQHCTMLLARDITERHRRSAFDRLLREIDRRILAKQPVDEVIGYTCRALADGTFGIALVQLAMKEPDGRAEVRVRAGAGQEILDAIDIRWDDSPAGQGPTGTAIRTRSVQTRDLAADPMFTPWRAGAERFSLESAVAIPLVAQEQVLGALTCFTTSASSLEQDTAALLPVADQIALAILAARDQEQIALQSVALESSANAVVVTDVDGVIRWVNPAFLRVTGYSPEEAIGQRSSLLRSGRHGEAFYRQMWETLLRGMSWSGELWNRRKGGELYLEEQTITPVRGQDGAIRNFVAVKQDITARRKQEEQIRHLAMHDALTDLPNRRALDAAMQRMCHRPVSGVTGALLIIDVDDFKPVNDALGHLGGDQLIAEVAKLLRLMIRPNDFIARLGGDEFAIVLHDAPPETALMIGERIRSSVASTPFRFGEHLFSLTVSVGIAPVDLDADPSSVMVHADSALYVAKDGGKNKVVSWPFGEEQGMRLIEAGRWAMSIRNALREERFFLCYQPVIRLADSEPKHHEALVRMIDEEGKVIPPDQFIAAAERFGLMPQIDRWVIDRVLRVLRNTNDDVRIFVNLSGASLGDASLLDHIEQQVRSARLRSGRLAFEITESAAIRDLASVQAWISKLRELGCLFAVDDFGVGFSSFSYLRALSVDFVKIDRSFVADVDTNATNRALVHAVMTVAQTLGKEVIAEGVETREHEAVLRELGVEYGQGYRWGHPQRETFEELELVEEPA